MNLEDRYEAVMAIEDPAWRANELAVLEADIRRELYEPETKQPSSGWFGTIALGVLLAALALFIANFIGFITALPSAKHRS